MSLEPVTTLLAARHRRILGNPEGAQRTLLRQLLARSAPSAAAKALGITGGESFDEFLSVPPRDYSFYAPLVERTLDGDRFAFGREPVVAIAETSGSSGQPKLIPHTAASLDTIKRFAERILLFQLLEGRHYIPQFTKWLSVTASTNVRVERGLPIGFISGLMYQIAQKKRRGMLLPSPGVAAISDWEERIRRSVAEAGTKKVGTVLGVPAYLARFLDEADAQANGQSLGDVWPYVRRIYYSGTSIAPYRDQLERAFGRELVMRGLYTASEGSFGAELDGAFPGELHLMVDMAIFTFRGTDDPLGRLLPVWELVRGRRYELFVTTASGLVQYRIGDVVEVTATEPLRVSISGRAQDEINLATEKMSLAQTYAVIDRVAVMDHVHRERFMVLPDPLHPRRHLWILERLTGVEDGRMDEMIDSALAAINPSYAALRRGDAVLERPRVVLLDAGSFDAYVTAGFARRGQFKFRHVLPDVATLLGMPGLGGLRSRLVESAP